MIVKLVIFILVAIVSLTVIVSKTKLPEIITLLQHHIQNTENKITDTMETKNQVEVKVNDYAQAITDINNSLNSADNHPKKDITVLVPENVYRHKLRVENKEQLAFSIDPIKVSVNSLKKNRELIVSITDLLSSSKVIKKDNISFKVQNKHDLYLQGVKVVEGEELKVYLVTNSNAKEVVIEPLLVINKPYQIYRGVYEGEINYQEVE